MLALAPGASAKVAARVNEMAVARAVNVLRMGVSLAAFWRLRAALSRALWSRLLPLALLCAPAQAQDTTVAVELVLALDASASVDRREFALQVEEIRPWHMGGRESLEPRQRGVGAVAARRRGIEMGGAVKQA